MSADNSAVIAINGGFAAIVSAFMTDSITLVIPWLFVMTALILADLVSAWRRCYHFGVKIRFSKGIRDTMSKIVIYYAFVVAAVFTDVAANADSKISRNACLLVCIIEGVSIVGNILKPHGIDINLNGVIKAVFRKKYPELADSTSDIIKNEHEKI